MDPPISNSVGNSCLNREAKDSALLSSRDGHLLEPTLWPKGSQASCEVWREDLGLLSRPYRKRWPSSRDDGGILWVFSSCGASVGFTRGTTGSSGSLSCGAREVRSPCAWRGGARYCSRAMVPWTEDPGGLQSMGSQQS